MTLATVRQGESTDPMWAKGSGKRSRLAQVSYPARMPKPRRIAVLALPLAALFAATACGGPDASVIPPADYFEVVQDAFVYGDWDRTYDGLGDGQLTGPHFSLALDGTLASRVIASDKASVYGLPRGRVAPSGYEILLAHFGEGDFFGAISWRANESGIDAELLVGDRVEKLDPAPEPGALIAVMVKEGEHAYLAVTDEGRRQELSLRDGSRSGEIPEYYGHPRFVEFAGGYEGEGTVKAKGESRSMDCEITFYNAFRDAWHPEFGWAKDGRAWLVLNVNSIRSDGWTWDEFGDPVIEWEFSVARSFGVKPEGGEEIAARDEDVISDLMANFEGFTVAFDIPADMTGGALVVHPEGKMTAVWSDTKAGAKWSKKPKAGEFAIVFSTE